MLDQTTQNPHRVINAIEVRALCGGISAMSLWRWLNDDRLDFPRPRTVRRRRYWREVEVLDWLEARAEAEG